MRNKLPYLWRGALALLMMGAWPHGAATVQSQRNLPLASSWAKRIVSLAHLGQSDELSYAVNGSEVAYIFGAAAHARSRCDPGSQIRLYNIATHKARVIARTPRTPTDACWHYDNIALSSSWLVCGLFEQTARATTLQVRAMNVQTGHWRTLAVSPSTTASGVTTTVLGSSLSGHLLAWSTLVERARLFSDRIVLQDLANDRRRLVAATPWFRISDQRAERIRSASLSGQRVVWTRLVGSSSNMMLYDALTRRTTALTHDNVSLAGAIYGNTVAWLSSKSGVPEGIVHVLDLRSGRTITMPGGVGFNIQVGDGLVSWRYAFTDVVPLYFVNRHALRYYRPTAAEAAAGAYFPDALIFGREVLVPVVLHFATSSQSRAGLHLYIY